jgi:hypothetical protein
MTAQSVSYISLILGALCGALLFVGGFLVGMWLSRHNTRYIDVPRVEIVKVPEPHIVERQVAPAPRPAPPKAATFMMQPDPRTREEQAEASALINLLDGPRDMEI